MTYILKKKLLRINLGLIKKKILNLNYLPFNRSTCVVWMVPFLTGQYLDSFKDFKRSKIRNNRRGEDLKYTKIWKKFLVNCFVNTFLKKIVIVNFESDGFDIPFTHWKLHWKNSIESKIECNKHFYLFIWFYFKN